MAVQSDTSRISYTGNNSTSTSYAVPFYFLENSHLSAIAKVTATGVETVVTLTNHTGAGDQNGGTVRTAVAVPATSTLTISRTVPATQTTTYQEGGDFPAASHERGLDKLTMLGQQIARSIARTVRLSDAAPESSPLPALPNRFFGTDANGSVALLQGTDTPAGSLTNVNLADNADIALTKLANGALPSGITVASANLVDGTIVDADISASAAIAASKLASVLDLSGNTVTLPDGNIATAKIANGAVTPVKLSQPFTLVASVPSTSGVAIDFTPIPSWAKRITLMLSGVSAGGTAITDLLVQLGTGSTPTTSGYVGGQSIFSWTNPSSVTGSTSSSGIPIFMNSNTYAYYGTMNICNVGGNLWVASGVFVNSPTYNASISSGGAITLGGALNMVRIATANGSSTFDAGTIGLSYEG